MAQYTNPIPGSCVTVNHGKSHTKISHGETKELPASDYVSGLVKRGKLVLVEEAKPSKPAAKKADEPVINSNQS